MDLVSSVLQQALKHAMMRVKERGARHIDAVPNVRRKFFVDVSTSQ